MKATVSTDYKTELFGLQRSEQLGISAPRLIVKGSIKARYEFKYFIMEHIEAASLEQIKEGMSDADKRSFASRLRNITDKMNTPCNRFNEIDIIERAVSCPRYKALPQSFQRERLAWLRKLEIKNHVYVHGDLTRDNVLVCQDNELDIIDFADACIAPVEYEIAVIVCELFRFQKPFLDGFFGSYNAKELSEKCLYGLLLHDFGANVIRDNICAPDELKTIDMLRERLFNAVKNQPGDKFV